MILIVLWAVKIISIINSPVYINTEIEQLHNEYTTYISQYEGKYSQSAEQIYDDYNDIVKAGEELYELFGQLDNKEINADTYKEKTAELNKCMQRSKLVTLAKEELHYYKLDKSDYSETLIFRETKGSRMYEYNSKYLGLERVHINLYKI